MQFYGNGWRFFVARSGGVFLLVAANIAIYIWLIQGVGGPTLPPDVLIRHGAMGSFALPLREYWRLVAYGFLHADMLHLATNMLCLVLWGPYLEKRVGSLYFVIIYLCALVGAALVTDFAHSTRYITVGASGAVAGILGALLCLSILGKISLSGTFFVTNIALNVAVAVAVPNVDWRAHAGGFAAGLICCAILNVLGGALRFLLRCKFPEFVKFNGAIVLLAALGALWLTDAVRQFDRQDFAWRLAACVMLALVAIKCADWLLCQPKGLAIFTLLFAVANAVIAYQLIDYFRAGIATACRAQPQSGFAFFDSGRVLVCADLAVTAQLAAIIVFVLTLLVYLRELRKGLADVGFVANGLQAERRRIEGI
jgi:rhomboid protease GluP